MNKKFAQSAVEIAESRYVGLYQFLDISKDFYFSYSYDLTHSLQYNTLVGEESGGVFPPPSPEEMFEWNRYQAEEFRGLLGEMASAYWTIPIIHGCYQQRRVSLFGQLLDVILISRRSRHYAGTRYLKRGVSDRGKVANDVEMEQIFQVKDVLTSIVQVRGSIPTFWTQETSVTNPKPPIILPRVDPSYSASVEHFADLIRRYSTPVLVLDLIKQQEKRKREGIVGREYRNAVQVSVPKTTRWFNKILTDVFSQVINSYMPKHMQVRYCALDFSRVSKTRVPLKRVFSKHMMTHDDEDMGPSTPGSHLKHTSFGDIPTIVEDDNENDSNDDPTEVEDFTASSSNLLASGSISPSESRRTRTTPRRKWSSRLMETETTDQRVDVLQELDDIAVWSVAETGFFCK